MTSLLTSLTEHLQYSNPRDMLTAYDNVPREAFADFLGVHPNTVYRWKKRLDLPTPRGRKTETLYQRIMAHGPEKLKDKTSKQIASLFGVTTEAVNWIGRKHGIEYRKR